MGNGCPITSSDSAVSPNHLTVTIVNNNDCHYDAFPGGTSGDVVYRRTDDPNNQNVYATSGDTAAESAQGYCTTRGSPDIYACAQTATGFVQGFDKATNKFTVDAATGAADDDTIFVNGLGPMRITSDTPAAKVTLTESYAGGMIYEECTGCVTAIDAGGITLAVSRSVTVKVGEGFMVQGYTDINQV